MYVYIYTCIYTYLRATSLFAGHESCRHLGKRDGHRRLRNKPPLLTRPLLRVCPSPLAFGLRHDPSRSAKACEMNARSRHETPRDEIPARARGMYLGICVAFAWARDGRVFCRHLYSSVHSGHPAQDAPGPPSSACCSHPRARPEQLRRQRPRLERGRAHDRQRRLAEPAGVKGILAIIAVIAIILCLGGGRRRSFLSDLVSFARSGPREVCGSTDGGRPRWARGGIDRLGGKRRNI